MLWDGELMLIKTLRYLKREGLHATLSYGRHRLRNSYYRWNLKCKGVHVGRHLWFDGPVDVTILNGGSITIGDRCNFGKYVHLKVNGGHIILKKRVKINRFCIVQAHRSVTIENDVLTAPYVHIMDANHNFFTDRPVKDADALWGLVSEPVVVGSHAWLGSRVIVLAGVTIGEHAVIGAGAVVTKDMPPYAVAAGVPCRVVKYREPVQALASGTL